MGGGFCPFAAPGYMVSANVLEERAPACSFLGASGCVQTAYSSLDGIPGLTISLLRDTDFPGLEKRFTNPSAQLVSFHVFLAIFLNYHSLMRRKPKILLKFSLSYMVCQ
jgi:hypothetical protein